MGFFSAATQTTYTRPTVSPIGARISGSSGGATYVKTTSGSIITVVPKSLATLGGKIISSNIVSGLSQSNICTVLCTDDRLIPLLPSTDRNHHKDHHHSDGLQAKRHRGSEDDRKGSNHPGPPWQERGHHTAQCRGQSSVTWIPFAFEETTTFLGYCHYCLCLG